MKLTEQQQKELGDVKERLAIEILIIDETYMHLFQSLRDDIRTLVAIVDNNGAEA